MTPEASSSTDLVLVDEMPLIWHNVSTRRISQLRSSRHSMLHFSPTRPAIFRTRFPNQPIFRKFPKSGFINIDADIKLNFFQTVGNHSKKTHRHGNMFASSLNGEVHGHIAGFTPQNMTNSVRRILGEDLDDQDAHVKLIRNAVNIVHLRIKGVLDDF